MLLMVWNINRFNTSTLQRNSPSNLAHIVSTLNMRELDIFIIVEVVSNAGTRGDLNGGSGGAGAVQLLRFLRQLQAERDWMLVPPLNTSGVMTEVDPNQPANNAMGQTYVESVAVFYSAATLNFNGPYYWDANQNRAVPDGPGTPYPANWASCLPAGNNRAAQTYFMQNGTPRWFPDATDRNPYYTVFTEKEDMQRTIKLFSVHLPPDRNRSALASAKLADVPELQPTAANDVIVVAGDLNYNLVDTTVDSQTRQFAMLFNQFSTGFTPANGRTRIQYVNSATPAGSYPAYGYLLNECLDNILVRYASNGANPGTGNPRLVINRVIGTEEYNTDMLYSIEWIQSQTNLTVDQQNAVFRDPLNYGHIAAFGGVSDHLALVMEI